MAASSPRRIVVTGSSGHLGRHVVSALVGAGHHVHAVDRAPFAGDARPQEATVADLAVWDGLGAAIAAADTVVHLAAIPNLDTDPENIVYRSNVEIAARVAFAAIDARVSRFVYASSQTVLGQALAPRVIAPERLPVDERHPLVPREGYGLSKLAGEGLAELVAERLGIAAFALRLPVVWSPQSFAAHVAKRTGNPEQGAKSLWAYVDARDAGAAFVAAVEAEADGFAALQIGADRPFADDVRPLIDHWYPAVPQTRLIAQDTAIFAIDKAAEAIGYRPRYRWHAEGIEDTAAASTEVA